MSDQAPLPIQFARVADKLAAIEAEMKQIGYWSPDPLPPEAYRFQQAFAMDTMAYSQWLQFLFVPRVRQIIEAQGVFPGKSMLGTQALREFDGDDAASTLVSLLGEFDALFNRA